MRPTGRLIIGVCLALMVCHGAGIQVVFAHPQTQTAKQLQPRRGFFNRLQNALGLVPSSSTTRQAQVRPVRSAVAQTAPKAEGHHNVPRALLPDGVEVKPDHFFGGYHGTHMIQPEDFLRNGLPAKGRNMSLLDHAEQRGDSAFRGLTEIVSDPVSENGAAYWAQPGGWVLEVRGVPGWRVNDHLEGRVQLPNYRYRGNLMSGEQEIATPAQIPPERIKAYGKVEADSRGRLAVREWIQNPAYRDATKED